MDVALSLFWVPKRDPLHNEVRLRRQVDRSLDRMPEIDEFIDLGEDGRWPKRVETITVLSDGTVELFAGSMYEINEGPETLGDLKAAGFEVVAA
jgi:hypothetical protein